LSHTKTHYRKRTPARTCPVRIVAVTVLIALLAPLSVVSQSVEPPRTQEFVITAYYSPIPGQCCYVKGGLIADRILNGEGIRGADGTAVYPGMVAAPPTYAFGTRIDLPGIGVVTVHDRGGAIQEQGNTHRLDLWVGFGEEGLARALAFGVRRVSGTIYTASSDAPREHVNLDSLVAPMAVLRPYMTPDVSLLDLTVGIDDDGLSVTFLQDTLKDIGYFTEESNGHFGPATSDALRRFIADLGLDESADHLSPRTAAFLLAAKERSLADAEPLPFVNAGSSRSDVAAAQRVLRSVGLYRGRTDGEYSDALSATILEFQQKTALVGGLGDAGAGQIGPKTQALLMHRWQRTALAPRAEELLALHRIARDIEGLPAEMLSSGDHGDDVRLHQKRLAAMGYFPADRVSGLFGDTTRASVIAFQHEEGIIDDVHDQAAGNVGPATLARLRTRAVHDVFTRVRSVGWEAAL
jgi:peptidoglycan hydrolase-like protein with peptidoglycan-binding domain/3D (Asp-Asp-Asp) domain-containing protein